MVDRDKYEAIMGEFLARMDEAATAFEREMSQHRDTLEKLVERQAQAGQDGKNTHGGFEASTAGGREAADRAVSGTAVDSEETASRRAGAERPGPGLAERDLKRAGWCVPSNLFD
ncbi:MULTISPECIES: hypothetical protein [unclassified Corynebacterium]|uniref:hypothetical protein n=1 Tax=unclassified Corynebacterium TaxID=2624378 RepID=UPI0008A1D5E1|nr:MULTISPECIES: hypothetical protein [unclassified Corynebacterium]OFO15782.1 hypothetical protein HMPREF3088_02860 [Corynebacterium sp. HMSC22B11]OFS17261.1 hypothetical protein HMPREF3097_05945 [Corynebacterium sp. HMSC27B11]